jgi:hypothetical protein
MNLEGGCNCGTVRFRLTGSPIRTGLCHCQTCRKETGSVFMAYSVWHRADLTVTGETRSWTATTDHRHFCGACGSALFATDGSDEIEIRIGSLDRAPTELTPDHELWVHRREHWQAPLAGADQHGGNRS